MRANSVMEFALVGRTLQWTFPKLGVVRFDVPDCGLDARDDAAMQFGYKQTIADAAAISNATPTQKYNAMLDRVATLNGGEWRAERGDAILVAAICRARAMSESNVRKFLDGKTAAQKQALAELPHYKAEIDRIRAARVANVDTSILESEIDAIES